MAYTSVAAPAAKTTAIATAAGATSGEKRMRRIAPAFTTPAWRSAETGVGADSVAGSQRWKGICAERPRAAITTRSARITAVASGRAAATVARSSRRASPPAATTRTTAAITSGVSAIAKLHAARRTPWRACGSER